MSRKCPAGHVGPVLCRRLWWSGGLVVCYQMVGHGWNRLLARLLLAGHLVEEFVIDNNLEQNSFSPRPFYFNAPRAISHYRHDPLSKSPLTWWPTPLLPNHDRSFFRVTMCGVSAILVRAVVPLPVNLSAMRCPSPASPRDSVSP